jgi:hypothetical protein
LEAGPAGHGGRVSADLVKRVACDAAIVPSRRASPDLSPDKAAERAGMPVDLHDFSLSEHDGSAPKGGDLKKRYDDLASQRD